VSSILNRLREVEGSTFSGPTRAGRGQGAQPAVSMRATEQSGRKATRKAAAFRTVGGILAAFAVFLLWRAWKGESPEGRTVPQNGRPAAVATQQGSLEAPPGTEASKGRNSPTGPASSGGSANVSRQDVLAAADPSARETMPPIEKPIPPWRDGQSIPVEHSSEEGAAAPPPTGQFADTLTAEEDTRTKDVLRDLKVTAVYRDAGGYLAFINGREVHEGGQVGHVEVAEIASERIVFTYKGKRYVLRLR
jgi:hypothetical protein